MSIPRVALRIFILEDHADTRTCLKIYLEELGHTVLTAASLGEATKEMRKSNFDVLLSDIGLSDGLGWEFLEGIHFAKPVFAIAMSGLGTEDDVERSKRAGFKHHLTKPVNFHLLGELLQEAAAIQSDSRLVSKILIE